MFWLAILIYHRLNCLKKAMEREGCVYIMTNIHDGILYTGVTSDLRSRVWEHKNNYYPTSFTSKYKCYKLVYYCFFFHIEEAIDEEKRIKLEIERQKLSS
jgi:putative endonuclease